MEETDKEERYMYVAQVSFWQPNSGVLHVRARDETHARELLPKLLPSIRDLEIHDIVKTVETPPADPMPDMGTPLTAAVN